MGRTSRSTPPVERDPERGTDHWRVGVASDSIAPDPDEPHVLRSFGARPDEPFDEIEHDLQAKAIALEDATGRRAMVVTFELAGTYPEQHALLESVAEDRWGVEPPGAILIPTHAHYAPQFSVRSTDLDNDADDDTRRIASYRDMVDETLLAVGEAAIDDLERAELRYYRTSCGIAMNRRRPAEDMMHFDPNPDAPVDQDFPVLTVEADGDEPKAILFGYACHPTVGTASYNGASGDWPGFTMRYLEADRPGTTAMFIIGCAGDQKAYPQGTRDWVRRHARTARDAVERALVTDQVGSRSEPYRVRGPLRLAGGETVFDLQTQLDDDQGEPDSVEITQRRYPIAAVNFGRDLTLLSLSGEVVPEISNRLQGRLQGPLWTAGYAHKYLGYIVTDRMVAEGGSEPRSSGMRGYRYAPGTANRVVETATALAERAGCPRVRLPN